MPQQESIASFSHCAGSRHKYTGFAFSNAHCFPASITMMIPRNLSGYSRNLLGIGIIPINCLLSPKGDTCWYTLRNDFTFYAEAGTSCFPKPHPRILLLFQCTYSLRYRWNRSLTIFASCLRCKKPLANSCLPTTLTAHINKA